MRFTGLHRRHRPPIDHILGPRDRPRQVGGEEGDQVGDLGRFRRPADGNAAQCIHDYLPAAVAIGAGLANSAWAADEEDFERLVDAAMSATEPSLIAVRIDDKPGVGTTRRDPVQIRERFMHGLGVREPL